MRLRRCVIESSHIQANRDLAISLKERRYAQGQQARDPAVERAFDVTLSLSNVASVKQGHCLPIA